MPLFSHKRRGGLVAKNGKWLVLTESTGAPTTGYRHKCGSLIFSTVVSHPILKGLFSLLRPNQFFHGIVPYCPVCEEKPGPRGGWMRERDIPK